MGKDIWDERRRGLEEEFFAKKNRELIENIRAKEEREKAREELARETGIRDQDILDSLINAKLTPATMIALTMVPLVLVAWADGAMEREEREAILKAAHEQGIDEGSAAYDLLTSWLTEAPSRNLFEAWKARLEDLKLTMEPAAFARLRTDLIERARNVALSAGGFLGFIGHKISDAEKREIHRLESAL